MKFSWLAVAVGLGVIVIWVGIDPYYPKLGHSTPFDPSTISPDSLRILFLVFRVAGAALVVPIMEELFWRGFLIRWIDNPDFKRVPIGKVTATSAAFTVILFGLEHEQWLAGMICGALYTWLLYRSRNLFSCVLSHAVSNATLAAWVLARQDWKFW